jgi:hypothetical protein
MARRVISAGTSFPSDSARSLMRGLRVAYARK